MEHETGNRELSGYFRACDHFVSPKSNKRFIQFVDGLYVTKDR